MYFVATKYVFLVLFSVLYVYTKGRIPLTQEVFSNLYGLHVAAIKGQSHAK